MQHSIAPRWEAWTIPLSGGGTIRSARRPADGALTYGDHPARLLEHIAHADQDLAHQQRDGS